MCITSDIFSGFLCLLYYFLDLENQLVSSLFIMGGGGRKSHLLVKRHRVLPRFSKWHMPPFFTRISTSYSPNESTMSPSPAENQRVKRFSSTVLSSCPIVTRNMAEKILIEKYTDTKTRIFRGYQDAAICRQVEFNFDSALSLRFLSSLANRSAIQNNASYFMSLSKLQYPLQYSRSSYSQMKESREPRVV